MESSQQASKSLGISLAVHALVVGFLLAALHSRPMRLTPRHLPGTPAGQRMLLSYSVGGPSAVQPSSLPHKSAARPPQAPTKEAAAELPNTPPSQPQSDAGTGAAGSSAHGDENIRIALLQFHPRPRPDLSSLAPGTSGDVVVDVVIDTAGKVTGTTLVKGLGGTVDTTVLAALKDWTFTPATLNGQVIASEQEILIHYERG